MTAKKNPSLRLSPSRKRAFTAALSVAGILLTVTSAHADATWNVDAAGSWATDSNWNPAPAPGSISSTTNTDTATFGSVITAARAVTVDTDRNISGINFSGNSFAYTLSGGNLLLTAGGTIQTSGAGSNTFVDNVNSAITLQGDYTFTGGSTNTNHTLSIGTTVTSAVSGGTTTLTLNGANTGASGTNTATNVITGVISNGTSTVAISKSGAGKWALSGANTFTGGVIITEGTLEVQNNAALGTGTVTLAGGTLSASGGADRTITNNITVQTGTTSTLNTNGRNLTINGNISGSGNINRAVPPTATGVALGGNNSGFTGTFTQANNGNAVVRFSSVNAGSANASWVFQNTTAGRTTIGLGGTGINGTISFGSMTGGGTIQSDATGTKTISAGALGLNDIFAGVIANGTGTVALTKVGTGTMTLSGNNTYTGATTVNAGTLALGAANRIANTSALVLAGGTFATGGFSETLGSLTLSAISSIDFGSGTSALVFAASNGNTWTGTLNLLNFDIGTDSLSFSSIGGLTVSQLGQISLAGFTATGLDASGFVQFSAIPEPSTYAVLAGVLTLGVASFRRRRTSV